MFVGTPALPATAGPAPAPAAASAAAATPAAAVPTALNPHPYSLRLPAAQPLSVMAQLGERLFHDRHLSGSGRFSCASCHDPARAYGPPGAAAVVLGGAAGRASGYRAVPSLRYLYRQPAFTIGPDTTADNDSAPALAQQAQRSLGAPRALKSALDTQAAAANLVPQGGLFWDGRANTLQQQADGPLFNPIEMGASPQAVLQRLQSVYGDDLRALFGPTLFRSPRLALDEAMFAIARYQIESPDFHPFTSKFDAWLAGRARFTPAELRGYQAFNDPARGNCAACHLDQPTSDGLPPLFTDYQYEALGVPRNAAIPANHDAKFFDLGLCGPFRTDMVSERRYCGMFLTPTLRNVATRRVFFHNGVFHSLRTVLDWYVNRDLQPERFYAHDTAGRVILYDDLPPADRANVDTTDAPFDRHRGDPPALSAAEIDDMIAFLGTLTDGYTASPRRSR
ncbi:MAG TPA: cytochrome c peroxidase [Steroidobacteraceae bacterium]|jgi:cytochrome c peroxidase|nr:cytochrome c peroxidase [Steroidobacteraceae bacterium]